MKELRIFISYSHTDAAVVAKITPCLEAIKVPYFLDQKDVPLGDLVTERVDSAFPRCSHLIVVIFPGSRKSQWVAYEIGFARGQGLTIIPFLTHPAEDLPPFIRDIKYATRIEQLLAYLEGLLAEGPKDKDFFDAIRKPDHDAAALAARLGHKEAVVGKVIEIWAHPSLESMLPFTEIGIDPLRLAFSELRRRRSRTFLCVVAA